MNYINFLSFLSLERKTPIQNIDQVSFFDIATNLNKKMIALENDKSDYRPKFIWAIKEWNLFINNIIKSFPNSKMDYNGYLIDYN